MGYPDLLIELKASPKGYRRLGVRGAPARLQNFDVTATVGTTPWHSERPIISIGYPDDTHANKFPREVISPVSIW